eukprot:scaffold843_cov327-Prasinococcus_capsulatus_cf.AAC.24
MNAKGRAMRHDASPAPACVAPHAWPRMRGAEVRVRAEEQEARAPAQPCRSSLDEDDAGGGGRATSAAAASSATTTS